MKNVFFVLAVLLFLNVHASPQDKNSPDKNFSVLLALGQSNMEGYSDLKDPGQGAGGRGAHRRPPRPVRRLREPFGPTTLWA